MNASIHLLIAVFAVLVGFVAVYVKQIVATVGIVAERVDEYMKDITTEVSGEDSDQCVGAMDAPTAAGMAQALGFKGLVDELKAKLDTPQTRRYWRLAEEQEQEILRQQKLVAEEAEEQLRRRKGMFYPGAAAMYYSTRRGWREATVVANSQRTGDHYSVIIQPIGSLVRLRRHVNRLWTPTEYKNL